MEKQSRPRLSSGFTFVVGLGTEAIQVMRKLMILAVLMCRPLLHGENAAFVCFDSHWTAPRDLPAGGPSGPDPLAASFVEAKLADRESRELLWDHGQLYWVRREVVEHPGQWGDGKGTGATPANGRAGFRMNRPTMRAAFDRGVGIYADARRRSRAVLRSGGVDQEEVLPCFVLFSTVGGQGSGSFRDACRELRQVASEQGIKIKIIACPIDIGRDFPPNRPVACRNRQWALNILRAESTGRYRDPEGRYKEADGPLVDLVYFSSGAGPHSSSVPLEEQEALLAQFICHLTGSPLGERLRERIVDLVSNPGMDEAGVLCGASASGFSVAHFGHHAVCGFIANRLAESAAQAILSAPPGDAAERGRQAAGELGLTESDIDNRCTRALTAGSEKGPDMVAEAQGMFQEGLANYKPRQGLDPLDEAHRSAVGFISDVLVLRMRGRADDLANAVRKSFNRMIAAFAREIGGLSQAREFTQALLSGIRSSDKVVSGKHEGITQAQAPAAEELNQLCEEAEERRQRNAAVRLTQFFTHRDTMQRYREVLAQMIRLEVDQAACLAAHELYLELQDFLLGELRKLELIGATLQRAAHECGHRAEELCSAPPNILEVAVGHELADGEFMRSFLDKLVAERGLDTLIGQLFGDVLTADPSSFHHFETHADDLAADLAARAERLLAPSVETLDAVAVLRDRYPEDVRDGIVNHLIKEAAPRIRTKGEATKEIPTTKLLAVPRGSDWGWLSDLINRLDRTPGQCEVVELPKTDSIIFATCRSSISLASQIELHRFSANGAPARERIQGCAEPALAFLPAGRMKAEDARVAAVNALACGLLSYDTELGYRLQLENGHYREIGTSPEAALRTLRHSFGDMVHVYCTVAEQLRDDGAGCLRRVAELEKQTSTRVAALYDTAALERALDEAKELLPYMAALRNGKAATE